MPTFEELPFDAQLAWLAQAATSVGDATELVGRAAALADVEPLCRLLDQLAETGAASASLVAWFRPALEGLADPALQFFLEAPLRHEAACTARRELARDAAERWPLTRTSALALLSRWLRAEVPEAAAALRDTAAAQVESRGDPRWLFFVHGHELATLAKSPSWADTVRETTNAVLDQLARAPKSLSQANAEELLSRQVYADPGHFLFELMQNADDAGATAWSVAINATETVVNHDGKPFSFRDVIGICSIGLTTKGGDAIGLFGVGFKSVFEVTTRPRIHSGAFHFEIAHVSMPRPIATEPTDDGCTRVVLPHRSDVDTRALSDKAFAIPAETLLTLPHVRRLEVSGADGRSRVHTREQDGSLVALHSSTSESTDVVRRFLRVEETVTVGDVVSPVLVAAAVDPDGSLAPRTEPGLYAFLPTAERTGLPVLVHARFEVTVDRERLEAGSERNRQLLEHAGRLYASLIENAASEGRAVLGALPVAHDVSALCQPVADALRHALVDVPCLPAADGLVTPSQARLLDPRLVAPFEKLDLGDGDRALVQLDERASEAARMLGARPFDDAHLLRFLDERLEEGAPLPAWFGPAVQRVLAESTLSDADLRGLPIVETAGRTSSSAMLARCASAAWARLYASIRPLVSTTSLEALDARLRQRLDVAAFEPGELTADLDRHPELLTREDALLDALDEATDELLDALRDVPLFVATDGEKHAVTSGICRLAPRLEGLRLEALALFADADAARLHPELYRRAMPRFDLPELVDALSEATPDVLDMETRRAIAGVLDAGYAPEAPEMSAKTARRAATLALFEDVHGAMRPLVGGGRALIADDDTLIALLPELPWLARPEAAFVSMVAPPKFDSRALLSALERGALETARWVDVVAWLGAHAGDLRARDVDTLSTLSIWPDSAGTPRPLESLRMGTADDAVQRFYDATGLRHVAHVATVEACRQLRIADVFATSPFETAIVDLLALDDPAAVGVSVVRALIVGASGVVSPNVLRAVLDVPVFEDGDGTLHRVGSWAAPDTAFVHLPGAFRALLDGAPWPLIAAEEEERWAPLFAAVDVAPARIDDVARLAASLDAPPAALLDALVSRADELDASSRDALRLLPLFVSRDGVRAAASELASSDGFVASLGADRMHGLGLDALLMSEDAQAAAERLGLAMRSPDEVVAEVLGRLVEGAPLSEQRRGLRTPGDLLAVLQLGVDAGLDVERHALGLDVHERLTRGRLLDAPSGVRALAVQLPLGRPIADPTWAGDPRAQVLLDAVSARTIALALKGLGDAEHERTEHPILRQPEAVYTWIRAHGAELAGDDVARSALGSARVMPSQRGTLRAPNELVLSGAAPELGLAWGLAEDVPADVAAWLSDHFQLGRQERKSLVAHVLDGVDEAVKEADASRVAELVRFLAASLGAGRVTDEDLERRCRRLKVRARLRVPDAEGGFVKPRFGWSPTEETAALAESFMREPPNRVGTELTDLASRKLLAACGARPDLGDDDVQRLLAGEGLREARGARVALARYVAGRATSQRRLVATWGLSERAWLPDRGGKLRRPSELLWPEPAVRDLFGEDAGALPEDSVVGDLPTEARAVLGLASVETLTPREIAKRLGHRHARPRLLLLIESGLASGRFTRQAVKRALGNRLAIRDDEGFVRPVAEMCLRGSRELFGPTRGDASILRSTPLLARALSVPDEPTLAMMLAFLEQQGADLERASVQARRDLARHVAGIWRRLAAKHRRGTQVALPAHAAVVALERGMVVVVSLDDPNLRLAQPESVAEALAPEVLDACLLLTDVAPMLFLEAGVADLLDGSSVVDVAPGVAVPGLVEEAEALGKRLRRGLGPVAGARVLVHERLSVTYRLSLATPTAVDVTVDVDAVMHAETLFVTPAALADPASIAPALGTEPARRANVAKWLSSGLHDKKVKRQPEAPEPVVAKKGWLSQVWDFLGGNDADDDTTRADTETSDTKTSEAGRGRRQPKEPTDAQRDAAMFRPQHEIGAQLEGGEGWVQARARRPAYGFRFTPQELPSPWLYAPKLVATAFDHRSQSWQPASLPRPQSQGHAGAVRLHGSLPAGDSVLPIPLYGRVTRLSPDEASFFASSAKMVRLPRAGTVSMDVVLGVAPDAGRALVSSVDALRSFVPDEELPDEVLAFVEDLEPASPLTTAHTIRDFVRRRYRYDPTYLEDAAVGRWLARVSRGRAHAHIAALHAGADSEYLGAGVCHELNTLACELMRRAAIPAGIATGWVFTGGGISEPDHLWVNVFLEGPRGEAIWVPIDASTTDRGRPLQVARRPRVRAKRPPAERSSPKAPKWAADAPARRTAGRGSNARRQKRAPSPKKDRRPPQAELRRLVRYLEQRTGREVTSDDKRALEQALADPAGVRDLLARLVGDGS